MTTKRTALIIANYEYEDVGLQQLASPAQDASGLAEVLLNPSIGYFDEVVTLVNETVQNVRKAVASFFAQKKRNDLLLLYYSGHGILDETGYLYLAVKDTERASHLLDATALSATFIANHMDRSLSRRQILILDCCHSGAFSRSKKGILGSSAGIKAAFQGNGYGRAILTATDAIQYAWEGNRFIGNAEASVFTHFLIEGLQSGQVDANQDGYIALDELYDYVYEQILINGAVQTPSKWIHNQQGTLLIAKSSFYDKNFSNPTKVLLSRQGSEALKAPETNLLVESKPSLSSQIFIPTETPKLEDTVQTLPSWSQILDPEKELTIPGNHIIRLQIEGIESTLAFFGIYAEIIEISSGPVFTQYVLHLPRTGSGKLPAVVEQIYNLTDDLSLALATVYPVRIEHPLFGKGVDNIGLMVQNPVRDLVSLSNVIMSSRFQTIRSALRIALGCNTRGVPISSDLIELSNLFIVGKMNSGTSTFIESILTCLLLQNTPQTLKLIFVDFRNIEFARFRSIPHLIAPTLREASEALGMLKWLADEVNNRLQLLAQAGMRNVIEFNKWAAHSRVDQLPAIIVFISEIADFMNASPNIAEAQINRIASVSRTIGVYFIAATHYPSRDVLTPNIKSHFLARACFKLNSDTESQLVLDRPGAENLLGKGDMLFRFSNATEPQWIQGCMASDEEIIKLTNFWVQ